MLTVGIPQYRGVYWGKVQRKKTRCNSVAKLYTEFQKNGLSSGVPILHISGYTSIINVDMVAVGDNYLRDWQKCLVILLSHKINECKLFITLTKVKLPHTYTLPPFHFIKIIYETLFLQPYFSGFYIKVPTVLPKNYQVTTRSPRGLILANRIIIYITMSNLEK